jgi:co-chaperonin GroES (HSP10)
MYKIEGVNVKQEDEAAIPEPVGYRLLIALPEVETVTKGGVHIPDKLVDMEKVASVVGLVVAVGDLAYKDMDKFPTGPWCKEGDYVIFRSYSGTRIRVGSQEFRLINDDTVEAVVDDPRKIVRAF